MGDDDTTLLDADAAAWARRAGATRSSRRRRSLVVAVAAGAILVVLVAATNTVVGAARRISTDANALSRTDESIRAATVGRTLAVVAAVTTSRDPAAHVPREEIDEAIAVLADDDDSEAAALVAALTDLLDQLGGRVEPAAVAAVENAYRAHLAAAGERRDELAAALEDSSRHLDDISRLAGLALLFVVPALAVGVHQGLTRPDRRMATIAHAADVAERRRRHRDAALDRVLRRARSGVAGDASPAVVDQALSEARALLGDVGPTARSSVDLRQVAADAVARRPGDTRAEIDGPRVRVWEDADALRTLVAALLATVGPPPGDGARATVPPRIVVERGPDGDEARATLTVLGGPEAPADVGDDPELADLAGATADVDPDARAAALVARRLAAALGLTIERVADAGREGWRLILAVDPRAERHEPLSAVGATP